MKLSPIYTKIQWGLTLLVLLIDIIWIKSLPLDIIYETKNVVIFILLLMTLYGTYLFYKLRRPDPIIMTGLISTFFFLSFSFLLFVLSYLSYTPDIPFYDATFDKWDSYFGFEALGLVLWFRDHPWLYNISGEIYNTYYYQLPLVILYFSIFVKTNDLQRFLVIYMICGLLTIFVSTFCPSVATYGWYGYPTTAEQTNALARIYELRNHTVNLLEGNGIIEFPSFHTAVALLYIYIFRNQSKFIFYPLLVINSLMIFACLVHGGHYLVDLFGGLAVFLIAASLEQFIYTKVNANNYTKENLKGTNA